MTLVGKPHGAALRPALLEAMYPAWALCKTHVSASARS